MAQNGKNFATHVKRQRVALGLSPAEAAARVGVSRQAWSGWERGTVPTDKNWAAIERALEWAKESVAAVLDGGEPTPLARDHAPPTLPAFPPGVTIDAKTWASWDELDRENFRRAAWQAEERRRRQAAATA